MSTTVSTAERVQETKETHLIEVIHFADPWCWWSWGLEPVVNRIKQVYGDQIKIVYKMGGITDNVSDWRKEYDVVEDEERPFERCRDDKQWQRNALCKCGETHDRPRDAASGIADDQDRPRERHTAAERRDHDAPPFAGDRQTNGVQDQREADEGQPGVGERGDEAAEEMDHEGRFYTR